MKQYIKKLIIISSVFVLLVLGVACIRAYIICSHSWKLPEKVHILFMGASHINKGIDDTMMESAVNWARGSERYMFTYIKLTHLLPENPQVDTIFLELAPSDLWEDTDQKYHLPNNQSGYVKPYWPFFTTEMWNIYISEPKQVANLILESLLSTHDLTQQGWWNNMGGYEFQEDVMNPDAVKIAIEPRNYAGHAINYDYLRRIISLCKERNIKLYFLETPTYHPEYLHDVEYWIRAYKENFSDVELLNYSKYKLPLDCYADPHHLNNKGAKMFTKVIMDRFNIK